MPQIRLRARPQIQVKLKTKIVLTDFISEISGTLHYALLMIPTGSGIRVIGGGDARRPGGGIPVTGEDARRLVQGCMQIADFGVTLDVQEGTSILPVMSVSFWAVFEKNKKRKKKFSMKTSSAETKSVIWLSVWLSFRGQICSCTTPRLDSFQLSDKHSRSFSHGIPFPNE